MPRKILLIEPNYKNKYPPIGLMKISTYHKILGDEVLFIKGDLKKIGAEFKTEAAINSLKRSVPNYDWSVSTNVLVNYFTTKRKNILSEISSVLNDNENQILNDVIKEVSLKQSLSLFDRIYVATLFTFYWDITVKTIEFAKSLVDDYSKIFVGGVMASLLKDEIFQETGIEPFTGLLDKPGILDYDNNLIIDELALDYSILYEIDYKYPTSSAYFTFMTKGCTRKCAFCSVPKLEPTYKPKIDALQTFKYVKEKFGEQRNLLLMDNNVLASPNFPEIIQEIKDIGFYKGATYISPNQLILIVQGLRSGYNDKAYLKEAIRLIFDLKKRLKGDWLNKYELLLDKYQIIDAISNKNQILSASEELNFFFEKFRYRGKVSRYVDFNQGIDARYVTEDNMRIMSEIPIKPLRIAFDHIGIKKTYINAVRIAAKYGINDLSNYILFNFNDKPEHFYERLKINVELGKELKVNIFSFPMKFVPLFGEEAKGRKYIGQFWNKKFLRAIQTILIATRGIVAPGYDFFEMAFGSSLEAFFDLLYMPEAYIINRNYFINNGLARQWKKDFESLDPFELTEAKKIIEANEFRDIGNSSENLKILRLMSHYKFNDNKIVVGSEVKKLRSQYNRFIRKNMFVELTLTHDFDFSLNAYDNV